jgi:hypothetical protein
MQDRIAELLARAGYVARGLVYLIVGGLALLAAFGGGGHTTGSRGALQTLLAQPFGRVLLGIVALGLLCFAAWRLAQAFLDADYLGNSSKSLARRSGFAVSALINAGLAFSSLAIILRIGGRSGGGDASAQDWTAWVLFAPFGQWLVGVVGFLIAEAGIANGIRGWNATFLKHLALPEETRGWVLPLGRFGYVARGVLLFEIGAFLVFSAWRADASEAKGLAGALRVLQQQPYGWVLLALAAAGLFAFGAFMLAAARYRKIQTPAVREAARKTVPSPNPIGA